MSNQQEAIDYYNEKPEYNVRVERGPKGKTVYISKNEQSRRYIELTENEILYTKPNHDETEQLSEGHENLTPEQVTTKINDFLTNN